MHDQTVRVLEDALSEGLFNISGNATLPAEHHIVLRLLGYELIAMADQNAPATEYDRVKASEEVCTDGSSSEWTAAAWITSCGVASPVATALLTGGAHKGNELAALRALLGASQEELAERLRAAGVVETLAALLHRELPQLAARQVTSAELHGKFAQDGGAFTMRFGDLSTFYGEQISR